MDTHATRKIRLVAIGCVLALGAGIAAVTLFNVPAKSVLFLGMVLICPLSHLLMGHGAHGSAGGHHAGPPEAPEKVEARG